MNRNGRLSIHYRVVPILFGFLIFSANALLIAYIPRSDGPIGQMLGRDHCSIIALFAIAGSAILAGLFLFYLCRAALGFPAIAFDGQKLSVNLFPFQTYDLANLSRVGIDGKWLCFERNSGSPKKVNLQILRNDSTALDELSKLVP